MNRQDDRSECTLVFTIGHSNHPTGRLVALLQTHQVTLLADVRSVPYSRHQPQFNRESLASTLQQVGVIYVYLGDKLGGRASPSSNEGSRPPLDYELATNELRFRQGIESLIDASRSERVVIMCVEREPLDCHRTLLVARYLASRGVRVCHIMSDGRLEQHEETENRLLTATDCLPDLFSPQYGPDDLLRRAYRKRSQTITATTIERSQ